MGTGASAAYPGGASGQPSGSTSSSHDHHSPTPKSSLAARRNIKGGRVSKPLQVVTKRDGSKLSLFERIRHASGSKASVHIKHVDNFSLHYTLGDEVMPSTHACMEVRHAMRLEDGGRVVIKVRGKSGSFSNVEEEKEWRQSMEFMLNLPKSGCRAELYEVLEDEKAYYVVMEKVDGVDLFESLDHEGQFSIMDCREVIRQLLVAVNDLHKVGVIHKDLKLENVMIDRTPKIADVRCASFHSGTSATSPGPVVKLIDFDTVEEWSPHGTRAKSVVGTDQYIAQEAYAGKYSPASDIFAVGVIAYRLLTGRFPFRQSLFDDEAGQNWVGSPKMKEIQERLQKVPIDWQRPPFPSQPSALELVKSMLAVSEADRPEAAQALKHPWLNQAFPDHSLRSDPHPYRKPS